MFVNMLNLRGHHGAQLLYALSHVALESGISNGIARTNKTNMDLAVLKLKKLLVLKKKLKCVTLCHVALNNL